MTKRDKNNAAFGAALVEQLERHSLRQIDLAKASGVSEAYISRLANHITPSPKWVEFVANFTKATEEERATLHRAAVKDLGYKI